MPIAIKTFKDFYNSIVGKFTQELPEVDPTINASLAKTLAVTSGVVGSQLQEGIQDAVDQMFWQTADDDFLEKIGEYNEVVRLEAQAAQGYCSVEGVENTIITTGTNLNGSNGLTYQVLQDATVQGYVGDCQLSFSGGIVTVITDAEHTLATGIEVTIANAVQSEYNGTFVITVIDENTFTYELTAGSLTTDIGDYSAIYASLFVECLTAGQDTNILSGGNLKISFIDVNDTAYVQYNSISGGADLEDIETYRVRVGEAVTATPGIATESSLIFSCKKIAGNTRVFVIRGTQTPVGTPGDSGYIPGLGETIIYILRDNDVSITPSQLILDETKQQILDDNNWATLVPTSNLYLLAPIIMEQDFEISDLIPNTVTMQNAIRDRLVDFFRDNASVGNPEYTIFLDTVKAFIRTVTDSTGAQVDSFTLVSPATNIVAASGEIYTRGDVTYV